MAGGGVVHEVLKGIECATGGRFRSCSAVAVDRVCVFSLHIRVADEVAARPAARRRSLSTSCIFIAVLLVKRVEEPQIWHAHVSSAPLLSV